jgi:hypothetical protein
MLWKDSPFIWDKTHSFAMLYAKDMHEKLNGTLVPHGCIGVTFLS